METTKEQYYRDIIDGSGMPHLVKIADQVDEAFKTEQHQSAVTKQEILNIKDDSERQKAIGENIHLFRK